MRVSIDTTVSCPVTTWCIIANPSTAPFAESAADPTCTGGVCGPAVWITSEALAASVRSIDCASSVSVPCCGNVRGSVSGPAGSPNSSRRASAGAVPLFYQCKRGDPIFLSGNVRHRADEIQAGDGTRRLLDGEGNPSHRDAGGADIPRIRRNQISERSIAAPRRGTCERDPVRVGASRPCEARRKGEAERLTARRFREIVTPLPRRLEGAEKSPTQTRRRFRPSSGRKSVAGGKIRRARDTGNIRVAHAIHRNAADRIGGRTAKFDSDGIRRPTHVGGVNQGRTGRVDLAHESSWRIAAEWQHGC